MFKGERKHFANWVLLLGLLIQFFWGNSSTVSATEANGQEAPLIMVEQYAVTDEKIVPGQDFTLTLVLKNCSSSQTVSNVMIDISNPNGVAPIYGTVSQVYVGNISAGQSKEISLEYNSWTSIMGDTLDFNLTIVSDQATNYVVLRIPVGSDSPFSVTSASITSELREGEVGNAALSFRVLAESNVRNMSMVLKENGEVIASSMIGIVTAGTSKSQSLPFTLETVGEHAIEIILQYDDEVGQTQEVVVGVGQVNVLSSGSSGGSSVNTDDSGMNGTEDAGMNKIAIMGISGILILIICLLIVILLRKNR